MKNLKKMLLLIAVALFVACESEDGKWDAMKWKADNPVQITDGVYNVKAEGEELSFTCMNYRYPWISNAVSGEEYYFTNRNNTHILEAEWFNVVISGNKLKIVFKPNKKPNEVSDIRHLKLIVTAGDIFYTFQFKQFAN